MICYLVLLFPLVFCGSPEGSVDSYAVNVDVVEDEEPVEPVFRKQRVAPEVPYFVPRFPEEEDPDCDHLRTIYLRSAFGLAFLALVALVIVSYTA